jgi:uncharacterized protein (DUF1786 family)
MRYTPEQVAQIAEKLRAMPPVEKVKKPDLSKQEAVRVLAKEIAALQKRGYTLVQISESLRGNGLAVATPTLKSYLQRAKPVKAPSKTALTPKDAPTPVKPMKPAASSKSSFQPRPDTKDI